MKKLILLFLVLNLSGFLKAQDTTVIQTLTFSDITKRRGMYLFPDTSVNYRKVIMSYTLKCDAATTWDNYACGEWDYLTYAFLYDHTGTYDSTATTHPLFKKGIIAPDTVYLMASPYYDFYKTNQYQIVYDNIIAENDFAIGSGSLNSDFPFQASKNISRAQFVWRSSELIASGLSAGTIDRMRFDVSALGTGMNNVKIRIRNTGTAALTSFDNNVTGWTEVYNSSLNFSATGLNTIDFIAPFTWNGTSNIIVEFSFENVAVGTNHSVLSESLSYNAGVIADTISKKYLDFTGNKYVNVDVSNFSQITDEITISLWMYGDPDFQPENGTLFEGVNSNNQRVLNVHLPWSNSNVYWDAGFDANLNSYDRINQTVSSLDFEGKWTHWAFTKNATTGSMKIYKNGILFFQGTGKTKTMEGITKFILGGNAANSYGYHGRIDEFCIFNKEVSGADILSWMNKPITAAHPNYNDLLYYFSFEENGGSTAINLADNNTNADLIGMPVRSNYDANALSQIDSVTTTRPNVIFVNGNYLSHLDSVQVVDSLIKEETSLIYFQVNGNYAVPYDTLYGFEPGYSYEFTNGIKTDSTFISGGTLNANDTLNYFNPPFEVLIPMEIGRFITPYGINLSLGPNGFEWRYDITDYANYLHDSVDISAGNTQELIDLKFILIEGTPPADVIQIDQLWNTGVASYSYANLDNDVNLFANTVTLNSVTDEIKLKTRLTGHGHNSNTGNYPHCCEWKDNTHYLFANGNQVADWHIWRDDCAENPVFPQGGTWPGQREGWCPGDVVYEKDFMLTQYIQGGQITLDYDITPVPASNLGMGGGNYVTAMHLVEYDTPNFSLDAEILDVIRPNDWQYQSRKNPICYGPKIILRNNGSTAITSATINYSVSGGNVLSYYWTGNLNFMESEEITLPVNDGSFWVGDGNNNFTVAIIDVNGTTDNYSDNDAYTTHFNLPDLYADNFVINLKTNNYPNENSYTIKDISGNVVMSRNGMAANTVYNDTLNLAPGCYTLEFLDAGEDGLSYWANTAQGSGYLRLRAKTSSTLLKNFTTDFGKSIYYPFVIGNITYIQENNLDVFVEVFPNPSNGLFFVHANGFTGEVEFVILDNSGKIIYSTHWNHDERNLIQINISDFPNGMYFFSVKDEKSIFTGKLVLTK